MHYMNRYGMLGILYRVQRFCMAPSGHKIFTKLLALTYCYYSVAFVLVHRVP